MAMNQNPNMYGLKFILESGEEHCFSELPIMIGRGESNDLILTKETVSARHARVYFDRSLQRVCIEDLDSLNGIFINRLPTSINLLTDGMQISLGDEVILYRDLGYIPPMD